MKVIKTTTWAESEKYLDPWEDIDEEHRQELFNEIEKCVMEYCRENDVRLSGSQYQHTGEHIPIVEHDGKEYAFQASMRHWGSLMYDLWGDGSDNPSTSNDPMGYCIWAWSNPDDTAHDKCKDCRHYYFNNMNFDKKMSHLHDHADKPDLNCRGIPIGPPKNRSVWSCDRMEPKENSEVPSNE
jgi:hypothetical protein